MTDKSLGVSMDVESAKECLQALNGAKSLEGLGRLRSVGLHKLTGGRSGVWAMTINGP
jgi:proteic killer suppression protein